MLATLLLISSMWADSPESPSTSTPAIEAPPTIVVILADDLGYGDALCDEPRSLIPTPHLDRLAAEGRRFTDAHAPAALCIPTRYGLLTGRYPFRTKLQVGKRPGIESGRATVASVLRDQGYHTAMVGKWHLGFERPFADDGVLRGGPCDRGFDSFLGIPASLDIQPYYWIRDRVMEQPPTEDVAASSTEGWTNIQGAFWRKGKKSPGFDFTDVLPRLGREASAVIERAGEASEPLFLYLALTAPHTPWLPTEEFAGKTKVDLYGDFVAQVDAVVGQVLNALERTSRAEDALVVFTSDNGPVWYPADEERFGHRSRGPLRGMKADSWEAGHRVPFVARWPERIAANTRSDELLCLTDLFATFASLAGAAIPEDAAEDSFDLTPALLGEPLSGPIRPYLVLKNAEVVRAGPWKLITHLGSGGFSSPRKAPPSPGQPATQLYNLDDDLDETDNLSFLHPGEVDRLQALLDQAKQSTRTAPQR